ncbi:MAG TPA: hypothetical protein VFO00_00820, partial [Vitreimonas sp.]|nr:hypothetical protein [Vitreimonas sp.]
MRWIVAVFSCVLVAHASAQTPRRDHAVLHDVAAAVSEQSLHGYIQRMVGFGTRHTMSDTRSNRRGIGAARRWVQREF